MTHIIRTKLIHNLHCVARREPQEAHLNVSKNNVTSELLADGNDEGNIKDLQITSEYSTAVLSVGEVL